MLKPLLAGLSEGLLGRLRVEPAAAAASLSRATMLSGAFAADAALDCGGGGIAAGTMMGDPAFVGAASAAPSNTDADGNS